MTKIFSRPATLDDIPSLLELHERNVNKSDFSMLLPRSLRHLFYKICVVESHTSINILARDECLIGVSIVTSNHNLQVKQYQKQVFFKLISYLVSLTLKLKFKRLYSILEYIFERKVTKIPKDVVANCVEMTILNKEYRLKTECIIAFFKMYSKNIDYLRTCGNGKMWASARADNQKSIRMIKSFVKPTSIIHYRNKPEKILCFIHEM
ncbi:hypothetical protein PQZ50_03385 [Methylophilaceae bacterium]|nr:hypothetical protein [Methylophilaceae bacterium]